jgi:folate-binding protein YgfZ
MSEPFWVMAPRDFVMVHGLDAGTYLQSQLSQELRDMAVGEARWSFVLQPTGKVDALVRVLHSGEHAYVLDTDPGFVEGLMVRLNRFRIRVKVDIEPIEWRCVAVRGTQVTASTGSVAVPAWWGSEWGVDLLGPAPAAPSAVAEGDADGYEAARITAGWPKMGADITAESIPGETGLTEVAVSFTKGCYPGQELVERMDSRGATAPRLLRALDLTDGAEPGDRLTLEGSDVGVVTSTAGMHALALVRRSVEVPATVAVHGHPAALRPVGPVEA